MYWYKFRIIRIMLYRNWTIGFMVNRVNILIPRRAIITRPCFKIWIIISIWALSWGNLKGLVKSEYMGMKWAVLITLSWKRIKFIIITIVVRVLARWCAGIVIKRLIGTICGTIDSYWWPDEIIISIFIHRNINFSSNIFILRWWFFT
jgi:hypothetical protein